MERHAIGFLSIGWRTPTIQTKEMSPGASLLLPALLFPSKRIQRRILEFKANDAPTQKVDHQPRNTGVKDNRRSLGQQWQRKETSEKYCSESH